MTTRARMGLGRRDDRLQRIRRGTFGRFVARRFGVRLRKLREERGWTQGQLGKQLGVTNVAVCQLEIGDREPKLGTVLQVARALRVSVAQLCGDLGSKEGT